MAMMIRTTLVVAVLWVVLVGIGLEKCRGAEADTSGTTAEDKEAKYQIAKEKIEAAFKEAKEIWSKMTPAEKEKAKAALKEAKEKAGATKEHPWSEEKMEKMETTLKAAKEKAKDKTDTAWLEKIEASIKEAKEAATLLNENEDQINKQILF